MGLKFKTPIVAEPYKFTWFAVEFPDPGPYEIIFRNKACLICGSDLHSYKGLHPFAPIPTCTGHEVAAEVVEVGSKVTTLQVGDRVYVAGTGASSLPCGQCFYCVRGERALDHASIQGANDNLAIQLHAASGSPFSPAESSRWKRERPALRPRSRAKGAGGRWIDEYRRRQGVG